MIQYIPINEKQKVTLKHPVVTAPRVNFCVHKMRKYVDGLFLELHNSTEFSIDFRKILIVPGSTKENFPHSTPIDHQLIFTSFHKWFELILEIMLQSQL